MFVPHSTSTETWTEIVENELDLWTAIFNDSNKKLTFATIQPVNSRLKQEKFRIDLATQNKL